MNLSIGGGVKSSRSKGLQDLQASLPLEMLRSWDFLNHGEERINPILRHPEQRPVNSSLRDITLCHPELVSGSSHSKTLGSTQKEKVVASSMGQMLKRSWICSTLEQPRLCALNGTVNSVFSLSGLHFVSSVRKSAVAFTLAEVLITLGIIGVVAALTLPTLIANYQKRVYVTQLKKSVSVLSNGFRLMMAHDGVTELKDTTAFSGMLNENRCQNGGSNGTSGNLLTDECRSMKEGLESVFSGIQFVPCNGKSSKTLNGGDAPIPALKKLSTTTCIQFPDGSEIIHFSAKKTGENVGIIVDINGAKNPNTVGRDIFWLHVNNNGHITGSYSEEESKNWRTATDSRYKCEMDGTSYGYGCAGRVLEEDAMNY